MHGDCVYRSHRLSHLCAPAHLLSRQIGDCRKQEACSAVCSAAQVGFWRSPSVLMYYRMSVQLSRSSASPPSQEVDPRLIMIAIAVLVFASLNAFCMSAGASQKRGQSFSRTVCSALDRSSLTPRQVLLRTAHAQEQHTRHKLRGPHAEGVPA